MHKINVSIFFLLSLERLLKYYYWQKKHHFLFVYSVACLPWCVSVEHNCSIIEQKNKKQTIHTNQNNAKRYLVASVLFSIIMVLDLFRASCDVTFSLLVPFGLFLNRSSKVKSNLSFRSLAPCHRVDGRKLILENRGWHFNLLVSRLPAGRHVWSVKLAPAVGLWPDQHACRG